jgi:POT family proton-dependent oligopeptide transporter
MVGNLYDDPKYADKRDAGFSIFYMAINIGALFAPTAAIEISEYAKNHLGYTAPGEAYHFAFAVACASLILSIAIYYAFRGTFRHTEGGKKDASSKAASLVTEPELSKEETKQRIVALCLVFAVVIFFWMAFHQNGLSLTYFADEFTAKTASGAHTMPFDVINLVMIIFIVYAGFSFFQSKTQKAKLISALVVLASLGVLIYKYYQATGTIDISAPIFQQFNPFYVVALTPVSMAIFASLANKGKEPSAPRKIAYGMIVAAIAYALMAFGSFGLPMPQTEMVDGEPVAMHVADVTPNLLITVYLVLTFGELLLSPMGISFVSKVAPPKYKGLMMGLWFAATAIGNYLSSIPSMLWDNVPLWVNWTVLMALCVISGLVMFSMLKKLEAATA